MREQFVTVGRYRIKSIYGFVLSLLASVFVSLAVTSAAGAVEVISITPISAVKDSGDTIVFTGSGFTNETEVRFGTLGANVTFISDTNITAVLPVSDSAGSVVVRVSNSESDYDEVNFTYLNSAPVVTSVTPNRGPASGGQEVTIEGSNFTTSAPLSYSGGGYYSLLSSPDGQLYSWGYNNYGQLGDNSTTNRLLPVAVDISGALADRTILQTAAARGGSIYGHTLALASDGTVYSWGRNAQGQLGNNSTTDSLVPVAVDTTGVLAGKTIVQVAAGDTCSLALSSDGLLYSWGRGQLGNNSTTDSPIPVAVDTTGVLAGKTITQVAAGNNHVLALGSDGKVYSWGSNTRGQLGNNSTTNSSVPVAVDTTGVLAGKTITQVAAGYSHSLALTSDGLLYAWGYNNRGQLGNNSTTNSSVPVAVTASGVLSGKAIARITAGAYHSLASASDGTPYSWGHNNQGQLGNNSTTDSLVPVAVDTTGVLAGKTVVQVAAGYSHSLVLTSDGSPYSWGANARGQLGNNSTTGSSVPIAVQGIDSYVGNIKVGSDDIGMIKFESSSLISGITPPGDPGIVSVAITGYDGQSSILEDAYEYVAAPAISSVSPSSTLVSGGDAIVITGEFTQNSVVRVGGIEATITELTESSITFISPANNAGTYDITVTDEFGQSDTLESSLQYRELPPTISSITPNRGPASGGQEVAIEGGGFSKSFLRVVSGTNHSLAIASDGTVYSWGWNNQGQLGNNTATNSSIPVAVNTAGVLAGKTITQIAAGGTHSLALASDGTVYSWGYNGNGELGNGTTTNSPIPIAVNTTGVLSGKNIVQIAAGDNYSLALASDGTVYSWGINSVGQLGNGSTAITRSTLPVAVTTSGVLAEKTINQIIAGGNHSLAVDSDGVVYSWGWNNRGQLGNNSTTNSPAPVAVTTSGVLAGKTITQIAAGGTHSLVLASDGTPYSWGYNNQGQLGNNSTTQSTTPVAVITSGALASKTIAQVAAGDSHSLVLASDGTPYSWGYNNQGQLGNNSTIRSLVPLAVTTSGALAGKTISQMSAGTGHSVSLSSDGAIYSWGINTNGQLGDGSNTQSITPINLAISPSISRIDSILFGENEVSSAQIISPEELNVTTPAGNTGLVDVTLSSEGENYVLQDAYEYVAPPVLDSVAPNSGLVSGGDIVVLSGSNFSSGSVVRIGVVEANIISQTANSITIQTPANSAGSYDVEVEDSLGQVAKLEDIFTYNEVPPVISNITPNRGPVSGGQEVTVEGSGFIAEESGYEQISTNGTHSLALTSEGVLYAWGNNGNGRLGDGSTVSSSVPIAVDMSGVLTGKTITKIAAGGAHSLVLTSDGGLYSWGQNNTGQLGDNSTANRLVPVAVTTSGVLAGKTIIQIAAGASHSLALASDGKVYSWGNAAGGILGNNSTTNSSVPVAVTTSGVLSNRTITQIAVGGNYSLALGSNGKVYSWGINGSGQLGDNSTSNRLVPVAVLDSGVLSGKTVTKIAAGGANSLVLTSDGSVYSWGSGRNGNGTNTSSSVPVAVTTSGVLADKTITQIAGGSHSLVLTSDGGLYSWGINGSGQLGDNSTTNRAVPVAVDMSGVLDGKTITQISTGSDHSLVLTSDGKVYSWGRNNTGQLGDGSTVDRSIPATVTSVYDSAPSTKIGANDLINTRLNSPTSITGTTPAGEAGFADVTVTNYDGQSYILENGYEYVAPPTISAVSPNSGSIAGGESVYVSGTGFSESTKVQFAGVDAITTFVNETTLLVTVPAGATPGDVTVSVVDEFNQAAELESGYVYRLPAPVMTSVSPAYVSIEGGAVVTITGSGFVNKTSGGSWYSVTVGGQEASNVTFVNATTLRATVPAHVPGAVDVVIGGDYSDSVTLENGLTYLPASYAFTDDVDSLMATEPGRLTIEARDAAGDPITSNSDVVIKLSSSSNTGFFAKALSGPEAGWGIDEVVIPAGQSSVNVYYRDLTEGQPTITARDLRDESATKQIDITSRYKILVTGVSNPINMGTPSSVTVQAVDYTGVAQADYRGTVRFSSTDGAATLPAEYTFTATDHGRKTFTNGVTMGTIGVWDVSVVDVANSDIFGEQKGIVVEAAVSGVISRLNIITPSQSFPLDQTSGVMTVQTQDVQGLGIPVESAQTIYLRSSSSTGQFSLDGGSTWLAGPLQTTIPANSSFRNFIYRDSSAGTHQIKVSQQEDTDFGWSVATQSVVVGVGAPSKVGLDVPNNTSIGQWTPVDVTITDSSDNKVTSISDIFVKVSVSDNAQISLSADGSNPASEQTTFVISGDQSVTVWVMAVEGQELTVYAVDNRDIDDSEKYSGTSKTIPLGEAEPSGLVFSSIPDSTIVNKATPIQVSLRDQFGNIVTAGSNVDATLTSDSTDSTFSTSVNGSWSVNLNIQIAEGTTTAPALFKHSSVKDDVAVSADSNSLASASGLIDVTADAYAGKVRFAPVSPDSVVVGSSNNFTVELLDAYGNPTIATETVNIGFGSNPVVTSTWNSSSSVNASGPGQGLTVIIPSGSGTATATYYDETSGTRNLQAYDQSRWVRSCLQYSYQNGPCISWSPYSNDSLVNHSLDVLADSPVAMSFTSDAQVIAKNVISSPLTVELQDRFGNPAVFGEDFVASLSTSSLSGQFAQDTSGDFDLTNLTFISGRSSASFVYRSSETSPQQGDTLSVSSNELEDASQNLRVIEGFASKSVIDTDGQTTAVAGDIVPVTLKTETEDGVEVVVLEDTAFNLVSTEGDYSFTESPFVPVTSAVISAESSSRQLFFRSTVSGLTSLKAESQQLESVSADLDITSSAFYKLDYSKVPDNNLVEVTKPSENFVVTAYDEYGNVAIPSTESSLDVSIDSSKASGKFSLSQAGSWDVSELTINAGASTTQDFFYLIGEVNSEGDSLVDSSVLGLQTLTASVQDALPGEAEVRVVGALATRIAFLSEPQSLRAGNVSEEITIQLQNTDRTPSISGDTQIINLGSINLNNDNSFPGANGSDIFTLTPGGDPVTTISVPAGSSTATFYVTPQTAQDHRIRVSGSIYSHSGGYLRTVSDVQRLDVEAGVASKLTFTSVGQTIHPDKTSSPIKIALTDRFGNSTVNETSRTINLQSSCITGVFLSSPNGESVTSLNMASGESEIVVYYRDTTASATPCEITASSSGLDSATQSLTVREPVYALAITSSKHTIEAGQTSGAIVVETRDRYGNTVTAEDPITVSLGSTGSNHTISPLQRVIQSGSSTAQFTFRHDLAVSQNTDFVMTVRDINDLLITDQQEITVTPGVATGSVFSSTSFTSIVGDYRALTVQSVNAYGKVAPVGSSSVFNLSTSASSGAFYTRSGSSYTQISSVSIASGSSSSETIYYRQNTSTRASSTASNNPATLRAQRAGFSQATASATITAKVLTFSTGNFSAQASVYTPMTIRVSSPLEQDLTVNLTTNAGSTNAAFYSAEQEDSSITSVVIPAGSAASAQIYYRQLNATTNSYPSRLLATPDSANVSVWRAEVRAGIYVNQFSSIVFVNPVSELEQGQNATFTVEARDDLGNIVPFTRSTNGYCLYIDTTSTGGNIAGSQNATRGCVDVPGKSALYVAGYATRATFTYNDSISGNTTLTVATNSGNGGLRASTDVTISSAITSKVVFDRATYGMVRGDELEFAISLSNDYGFKANTLGETVVSLQSSSSEGKFYDSGSDSWVSSLQVSVPTNEHTVSGLRYTDSNTAQSSTLTATSSSIDSSDAIVNLGTGSVSGFVFKDAPSILSRGQVGEYVVSLVDDFNNITPATADTCVYLTSSNTGGILKPSSSGNCSDVTLPGGGVAKALLIRSGQTEVSFTYQSYNLEGSTLTISTLPTGGGISASHSLSMINGDPASVGVVFDESTLERGGVASGRAVVYNAYGAEVPVVDDLNVNLSSDIVDGELAISGDGPWANNLNLLIPSASSGVEFLYRTGNEYLGFAKVLVESTDSQIASGEGELEVVLGEVKQIVFVTPELTTTATHPSETITIEARNRYGVETITESDLQVFVRSSSTSGVFAETETGPWGINSVKFTTGQSQVSFNYRDETVGIHTMTVRDRLSPQEGEEFLIATQNHNIVEQEFSHFVVTNISTPTQTGIASSVVVFAMDSENYVIAGYDGTITFSSDDPTAVLPGGIYTFVPAVDRGIHTFTNGVAFREPGIKTVTVTDQDGKQGSQFDIEVEPGNAAPVRSVEFADEATGIAIDKNSSSDSLTLRLRDEFGALTNAPIGGTPLRITSDSETGQFSTDGESWSSSANITVESGLSFSTTPLYYRDSTGGEHILTVSDWIAGVDSQLIENGQLQVTINDIVLDVSKSVKSLNAEGVLIENPYLFSRNKAGEISGQFSIQGSAKHPVTGNGVVADWSLDLSGSNIALGTGSSFSYTSDTLNPAVGANHYGLSVNAVSGTLQSAWQDQVMVSPWRVAFQDVTMDDTVLSGKVSSWNASVLQGSPRASITVKGGVNSVTRTWSFAELMSSGLATQSEQGVVSFRVPLRLFAGGDYSVIVELTDGNGITAQDITAIRVTPLINPPVGPTDPTDPSDPSNPTIPGGSGSTENGGGSGITSPENPGDPVERPEPIAPTPPREGAYKDDEGNLIAQFLRSPSAPIRVAQSLLGLLLVVAIVLAYQMYREWRQARFLLAIIRKDNETLANKDAFLQLAAHHLRTPITLLAMSADMIANNPLTPVKNVAAELLASVTKLRDKTEDILQKTHSSVDIATIEADSRSGKSRQRVYSRPVFWLPVVLSIVLTVVANFMISTYGNQTISGTTILNQFILLAVGGVIVYTVIQLLSQRKQRNTKLRESREKVDALNRAKINFARQVGKELLDGVVHISAHVQNVNPFIDSQIQKPLQEGTDRLERLVSRFTLVDSIYNNQSQTTTVTMKEAIDEALSQIQRDYPGVDLSLEGVPSGVASDRSRWLVVRLMQDVLKSMTPKSGAANINVSSKQTNKATELTIVGLADGDLPAEDLFSIYSKSSEELAGTYQSEDDVSMTRLDMYLERLLADELDATIEASKSGSRSKITISFANASA